MEQYLFCYWAVECARVFHAAGARLVLCGRDATRLRQVMEELTASSTNTQQQACKYAHTIKMLLK